MLQGYRHTTAFNPRDIEIPAFDATEKVTYVNVIRYSKQAAKFLARQELSVRRRINNAIETLPAGDVKKLRGQPYYRLRVGDFRILFDRDGNVIEVVKIDSCGQVYK